MSSRAKPAEELVPELREALERTGVITVEARELLGGSSAEQLNWKPSPKRWSVGENVRHMCAVNTVYLNTIEEAGEKARAKGQLASGPFRYGWLDRWFVSQLEPPRRRRFKAPRLFVPAARTAGHEDVEGLLKTLDRLGGAIRTVDGLDLAKVKIPSPLSRLLRFSLGTGVKILIFHTARHLQQARSVTFEPGFPTGETT